MLGFLNQYKCLVSRFPSDLKKSTVVDESLSSNQTNVLFQRLQLSFKIKQLTFDWVSADKYAELRSFRMELNNMFQSYSMSQAEKCPL